VWKEKKGNASKRFTLTRRKKADLDHGPPAGEFMANKGVAMTLESTKIRECKSLLKLKAMTNFNWHRDIDKGWMYVHGR
jgi:hypothetical protein